IDGGVLAHAEEEEGDAAEQRDDQRKDGGEHRPPDADLGQPHPAGAPAANTGSTATPGRRRSRFEVSTTSPGASPARISIASRVRRPICTSCSAARPSRSTNTAWLVADGTSASAGTRMLSRGA